MIHFFKTLLGHNRPNQPIQPPELSEDHLFQVISDIELTPHTKLIVGAGQVAVLYAENERTNIYPTGEHPLLEREKTFLNQHSLAQALYIQTAPPISRQWTLGLTPVDSDAFSLNGQYKIAVENAKLLCEHLIQPNIQVDNTTVDGWINIMLKEIIQAQHITVTEINQYRHRFEQFLIDAINPILFDKGLALRELNIHEVGSGSLQTDKAVPFAQNHAQPTEELDVTNENKQGVDKEMIEKTTANAKQAHRFQTMSVEINQGPKIYYRVLNGYQDGPYSVYQLQQLIEQKSLKQNHLVWKKGLPSWQRADTIEQLIWSD